ncbi:hypothetical protein SCP_0505170 [Sparassis crispa]|uniref:Uncharacterized protein n=1 Tax=Sparassis crispa TaxID=139825 RepID=A0A401GMM8_9APHY|nr:hypothetical protein SCP_0505170 [Sparassis crispa]GBE83468.1 hypothetical protein SCP_0505170 [Sparassis crispa]
MHLDIPLLLRAIDDTQELASIVLLKVGIQAIVRQVDHSVAEHLHAPLSVVGIPEQQLDGSVQAELPTNA